MQIGLAKPTTLPLGRGTFQRRETLRYRETLFWSQMRFPRPTIAAIVTRRRTTSGGSLCIPTHFELPFIAQASISSLEPRELSFHATATAVIIRSQCWLGG